MNFAAPPSLDDSYPLCLNFLNVTDELFGISPPKPSDIATFLNWVKTSDVAPSHVVEEIRASAHPDELQALFVEARELATWFRRLLEDFRGKRLPVIGAESLVPLNRILERDVRILQITSRDDIEDRIAGSGLKSLTKRVWRSSSMLLVPIADDIARLLCEKDFRAISKCEATDCGAYFISEVVSDIPRPLGLHLCRKHAATQPAFCKAVSWI